MDYYLLAFKKYAEFSGRSRRKEYWYFILFNNILLLLTSAIGIMISDSIGTILYAIAVLVTIIPGLAVSIRRLHDLDRSGWFLLLGLIPLIGAIILLVWFCTSGTEGPNQYGPDPKRTEHNDYNSDILDSELV